MKSVILTVFLIGYAIAIDTTTIEPKPVCSGKNTEWRECSNLCGEKRCDNFKNVGGCFSLRCGPPACVCKEGHVFLSNEASEGCVRRETCLRLDKLKEAQKSTIRRSLRL